MAIVGASFLLSALVLMLLPADQIEEKTENQSSLMNDMKLGFQYVWKRKILITLGAGFLTAGLGLGFIHPLAIFIVTDRLGLTEDYLQWLFVANGSAMIIGGGLTMALANRIPPHVLVMLGMGIMGIGITIIGWSTHFWLTMGAEFMIGLFMPALHIGISTIILKNTEEAFVGRVNGILTPLFMGAMVVTMSLAGELKLHFSIISIYQISALFFVLGVLVMVPMFRLTRSEGEKLPAN
jgi:MFS family permease